MGVDGVGEGMGDDFRKGAQHEQRCGGGTADLIGASHVLSAKDLNLK